MKTFFYFIWVAGSSFTQKTPLFECQAAGIVEADKAFTEATGKDPARGSVQCQVS